MKHLLLATAALLAASSASFAQSNTAPGTNPTGSGTPGPAVPGSAAPTPMPPASSVIMSSGTPSDAALMFATIPAGEDLSSNLIGLDIYNGANEKIGEIKDIAMNAGRVHAYIIGVGGFLGMGDHYVAVTPQSITISYVATDKKWHATMNTDAAALKAAPEYKYQS